MKTHSTIGFNHEWTVFIATSCILYVSVRDTVIISFKNEWTVFITTACYLHVFYLAFVRYTVIVCEAISTGTASMSTVFQALFYHSLLRVQNIRRTAIVKFHWTYSGGKTICE